VLCHVANEPLSPSEVVPPLAPNGTERLPAMPEIPAVVDGPITKPQSAKSPVRLGAHLTLSDHERLRVFIHEFLMHGLIPRAEKTIRTLNEQVSLFAACCWGVFDL